METMQHQSLSELTAEVEAFQQNMPASVNSVSIPTAVGGTLINGKIHRTLSGDQGPWQITLKLSGPSPCYSQPITARVVFYADKPLPTVSFHTITYHKHTANPENAGLLPEAFYQELAARLDDAKASAPDGSLCRLGAIIDQVEAFFSEPLMGSGEWKPSTYHEAILRAGESMNIPQWDTKTDWEKIATVNQARNQVIEQYVHGEYITQLTHIVSAVVAGGMCKHPELFQGSWNRDWLCPDLAAAIESGDLSSILREETPGVYSSQMLRPEFCEMLLEECDQYTASGLPIRRPNSM